MIKSSHEDTLFFFFKWNKWLCKIANQMNWNNIPIFITIFDSFLILICAA